LLCRARPGANTSRERVRCLIVPAASVGAAEVVRVEPIEVVPEFAIGVPFGYLAIRVLEPSSQR